MRIKSKSEDGLVSIFVVSVIIIILALMTIGFAKLMDRELRQSLDRELATQGNYAAESGINDVRAYISAYLKSGQNPDGLSTNGCLKLDDVSATNKSQFMKDGNVSGNNVVKYTCVIIDSTPKSLIYKIKQGESVVFKMVPNGNMQNLYFGWENNNPEQNASSCNPLFQASPATPNQLPKESDYSACQTGMLRTAIYPVPNNINNGNPNSDTLNNNLSLGSRSYFLYPNSGSANNPVSVNYNGSNGAIVPGNCNTGNRTNPPATFWPSPNSTTLRYCNSVIQNVTNAPMYYVKLTALYKDLAVSIEGGTPGNPVDIGSSEALIDVTGSGNDVLKRLQARISLGDSVNFPAYGIQSMDTLCKRLRLPKTGPNSYGNAYIEDSPAASADSAACHYNGLIP